MTGHLQKVIHSILKYTSRRHVLNWSVVVSICLHWLQRKSKELVLIKHLTLTFICQNLCSLNPISGPMTTFLFRSFPWEGCSFLGTYISENVQQLSVAGILFSGNCFVHKAHIFNKLHKMFLAALLCTFTYMLEDLAVVTTLRALKYCKKGILFLLIIAFSFRSTMCFYSHP